jgi:hypothetical protein
MKWFECVLDLGDGSVAVKRFKSRDDAKSWAQAEGDFEQWDCYPYGPLKEVDTDSKYFWSWPNPWSITK